MIHDIADIFRPSRPLVMGIVNVTPDSFYAGSRAMAADDIECRVRQLADEGADILDLGACSTRPGSEPPTADEELRRLELAMQCVRRAAPGIITSVDTWRASVARHCVEALGVDIVNDVSGGTLDPDMWPTVARLGVPYVLMHMRGTPATMQSHTSYNDVVADVTAELADKLAALRQIGVERVILDPGFGFAKTLEQNYQLLAGLERLRELGAPLLVGVSRKSMIYKALGITPDEALTGTTVVNTIALMHGAHILRVHDVKAAVQAVALTQLTRRKHNENKNTHT